MAEPVNIFSQVSGDFLSRLCTHFNCLLNTSGLGSVTTSCRDEQIILHRNDKDDKVIFEIIGVRLYHNFKIDKDLFLPCLGFVNTAETRARTHGEALELMDIMISDGSIIDKSIIVPTRARLHAPFRHYWQTADFCPRFYHES